VDWFLRSRDFSPRLFPQLFGYGFAFVSGFFVARFPVRPELAFVSAVFVLAFAAPSYLALIRWVGAQRGVTALVVLGLYALCIETLAVKTGVPYGRFSYGAKIGTLLFDAVPWTVFFTWTPLVLLSLSRTRNVFLAGLVLVAIDLVLDPGAVAQGFWRYEAGGLYYAVPFSNFAGWLLTGTVGVALALRLLKGTEWKDAPATLATSGLLSVIFWTSVCLWMGLWIPAGVGVLLTGASLWQPKR
jgi:putative membrane protein